LALLYSTFEAGRHCSEDGCAASADEHENTNAAAIVTNDRAAERPFNFLMGRSRLIGPS
jgi:hypothetical protein